MGACGYGIRQDDFVGDVIGVFEDFLKQGKSVADATEAAKPRFGGEITDSDDGPLFWIALADVQWTYGGLEVSVLGIPATRRHAALTRKRASRCRFPACGCVESCDGTRQRIAQTARRDAAECPRRRVDGLTNCRCIEFVGLTRARLEEIVMSTGTVRLHRVLGGMPCPRP